MKVLNDEEILATKEYVISDDGLLMHGRPVAKAQYQKDIKDFIGLLDREYEDWTASYDHIGKLLKTLKGSGGIGG